MKWIKDYGHIIVFLFSFGIFIAVVVKYCGNTHTGHEHEHPKGEHPGGSEHPEHPKGEHPGGSEHPEHPEGDDGEHPEHPAEHPGKTRKLTLEEFVQAAEDYIELELKIYDGVFPVKDSEENRLLQLELVKIHKERLSPLGDNTYFVCADFKTEDGTVYDIDIFMQGGKRKNLIPTDKMVHKVNGKPRFTWYEEEGVWKQKKLK